MSEVQPITMPALSDTMSNGRLVKWIKKSGDKIAKGDVIAEVETDKAIMEVEAFQDGYLSGPLAAEGGEAPVGQVIGYIAGFADDVSDVGAVPPKAPLSRSGNGNEAPAPAISAVLAASMTAQRPMPGPREPTVPRKSASSGLGAALEAGPAYRLGRPSSMREAVARAMIASAATPTFHVTARLPVAPLMAGAQAHRYSLSVLFARACALTVAAHPRFNAAYTPDGLALRDRVDIGIAVDHGDGLITPVLRDAARRPLAELAQDWIALRERARNRRLAPAEYSGATFYVSDLGVFPIVSAFDSIVPIGAAAILSVAAAGAEGAFVTLSCDHRVVFGADAARFLGTLDQHLRDPAGLFAEPIHQ